MRHIEALLRRHIGLDPASVGSALIERTVRLRMKQHGLKKPDAYRDLLATSHHELNELIEAVVVTETWFFRDREPFHALTQLALKKQNPHRHSVEARGPDLYTALDLQSSTRDPEPLRILSLPCATGEEPYSIAMALLDAGLPAASYTIEAADISANALTRAARAVYGKNSFRGSELAYRDRHFLPTREGYALNPHVRHGVKFFQGNILTDNFLADTPPYDFIFCRNLLIYFDTPTQILALGKLHRLLAEDGVLFVGPAELPLVSAGGFVNASLPMAFACQKAINTQQAAGSRQTSEHRPPPAPGPALREPPPPSPDPLALAHQHTQAGRHPEAIALCQAQLTHAGPTAQAYYLLGLATEASDEPAAIAYYRKALYLEPRHYPALVQITRALKKAGDQAAAQLYQQRAHRAQPPT